MKKLPLLLLATGSAGLVVLYACGGSSGDDDDVFYDAGPDVLIKYDTGVDGPDPSVGMGTTFCQGTLGQISSAISTCCTVAEQSGLTLDIYKNIAADLTQCQSTLESSIGQHRTSPNTANYQACLNGYKAVFSGAGACQGLDEYRPGDILSISCAGAFTGKQIAGEPCAGDFDCANGLACVGYGPGTDGKCAALVPADGTCGATGTTTPAVDLVIPPIDPCVSDYYCDTTCKPMFVNDAGCTSDNECTGGVCSDTHCRSETAGTRLGAGSYCTTNLDCSTGLFCLSGTVPTADGGAPYGATGTCTSSEANTSTCLPSVPYQCQGRCSGTSCEQLCGFP